MLQQQYIGMAVRHEHVSTSIWDLHQPPWYGKKKDATSTKKIQLSNAIAHVVGLVLASRILCNLVLCHGFNVLAGEAANFTWAY